MESNLKKQAVAKLKVKADEFDNHISSMAMGNDLMMDDIVEMMDHGDDGGDDDYAETPMGPGPTPNGFDDEKYVESGGEELDDDGRPMVVAAPYNALVSSMKMMDGNESGNGSEYKMNAVSPSSVALLPKVKSPKLAASKMKKRKKGRNQVF